MSMSEENEMDFSMRLKSEAQLIASFVSTDTGARVHDAHAHSGADISEKYIALARRVLCPGKQLEPHRVV